MPIFDKELIDNISNRENVLPNMPLGSPVTRELNTDMGGYGLETDSRGGLTIDQLSNIKASNSTGFDSPFQMIPKSELLSNQRYSMYERDKDLENTYGLQQGALSQLGNGVIKMATTVGGTFLQGFATIPNTIASFKGGVKELSGVEGYESDIDNWLKNIEDRFPNYVTKKEQEHPFLAAIPGFAGSANFWGDKIIKNIGFTVGAIGSALVQDAVVGFATEGLGEIPLVANQIGKASLYLNKLFTGTNDIEKTLQIATSLGKSEKAMLNIKRLGELAAAEKVSNGFRYGLNIYSSARTEAAIEARDGYRQVKEILTTQYKEGNLGEEPSGKDLTDIEQYATDAMNTRFGINMAILTVSNAFQFDNLFKSVSNGATTKGVGSGLIKDIQDAGKVGLKEGSLDVFEKKLPTSFMGKVWESVKPKTASIFREGVYEEGGQYAAERGTYDYYTRKYKDPKRRESIDNWNTLNEVIDSTVKGLNDQFGTTEGIENMLIGGISGMLMDAGMQTYDRAKGKGKDKRLDTAVSLLNRYGLTGILGQKYTDTLNSVNIAQEMTKAARTGNVFRYQNLKDDMFFGFVNSRLGSNMHDVTIEQLRMLKDLDKEEFEKTFGMNFSESNKSTVGEYVDGLISKANEIKKISDSVNNTYKNVFTFYDDPGDDQDKKESNKNYNTFETWKTNLIYEGSVMKNTNQRLVDVQQSLSKINPLITNDLASRLMDEDSLRELSQDYEEQAKTLLGTLNDAMSFDERRKVKEQAKQLRTASEIAMMAANDGQISQKDFAKILNYELNGRDGSKDDVVTIDRVNDIQTLGHDINMINARKKDASNAFEVLSSEKGFEKFFKDENDIAAAAEKAAFDREEVKKRPLPEFTNVGGVKEAIQLEREYQAQPKKGSKVRKLAADRFRVIDPDGKVTFYPTREKAQEAAADIDLRYTELSKVKILAVNADGTIKVQDVKGNIQNIGLGELEGYEKIITEQERLQQFADQMKQDQEDIEKSSGVVGTNPSDEETVVWEDKKRDISHLFNGGITESERWENPEGSPIHIQNSRYFLNNARNFPNRANLRAILVPATHEAAFGLAGLTAISYKSEEKDPTKIPGATDPKTGFIAQVFVEQDGSDVYFVDKEGNRIGKLGEAIDIEKVIFQAMPAASLEYSDGSQRYRNHQAADAEVYKQAWEIKRVRLFGATPGTYQLYTFKISRGIAREIKIDGKLERNPISDILVDMNLIPTQEGLIQISTTGNLAHQGEQLNFPKGRPILQFEDVFVPLNNRKFTANEAETIFELLNRIGKETVRQSKFPGGPAIRTNRRYARFLQGLLFWKSEITGKKNPNNMYINEKEGNLYLGGVAYDLTNLEASKTAIIDHLKATYNNINNSHLTETFSEPFIEYRMENGDLVEVEWQNYQTYLLSKENPDGSSRGIENIPLVTSVQKATDTLQPFEQKYAIMEDLELPIAEVPKPETKVSTDGGAVEVGGFKIDGSVQTYRGFNAGPVEFTAIIDKDGFIEIDVKDGDTVNALAGNEKTMNDVIIATLKALGKLDEKALEANDNVRLVKDFLGLKIAVDLQAKLDAAKTKPTSTAPKASAPIEISSNAKGFGAVLTNPTEIASSKKNITNVVNIKKTYGDKYKILKRFVIGRGIVDVAVTDTTNAAYPIEFEGQLYADAEAAYQDQKAKYSNKTKSAGSTYDLMVKILTAKLQQYPQMVDEIKKQGGTPWLSKAVHQPTNKNSVWETGGQNWFVLSLVDAYTKVLPTTPEKKDDDKKEPPTPPPPPAPSGPTPTVTFEGEDTPDDAFRRLSRGKERSWRTTQGDIDIFKKWVAENAPGIPYEILEQMIDTYDGEKAWGVYENGIAKFFKGGLRGTEYHEIFEGIWKHFLTDSEKQAIIDEFRTKPGKFIDRESGKSFNHDDSSVTDKMIKERIADDFADFRLGKIPATSLGGKIIQFFKRIIDFIKSFLFKPDLKTKLFQQINTGRFKTATLQITKEDVDNTFRNNLELENKVLESYGYVAAYQGTRGDIDNREVNYFTLDENEASDYGITRKVAINTEGFIDATTDEYRNLKNEDQKLTGTRVDLMDNSVEGLAKQQQFFNFLMSKGYKGIDNTGFEDSKYLIAFQNQDFEKQAEVPKMLYTKYIKSVQSRGSETDMDKFQQWAKNYGIPEYSRAGILTETQTHQFVQDLTARAAGIIFNENDVQALYEPAKLTSGELFSKIANQKDMISKKAKMGEETWNALIVKTKEQLRTLGIDFTEEDRVNINDSEKTNRDYAPEPFATDWKKYSYFPVKILLATLIETEPMNQSTSTELKMPNAKFSTEARGLALVNFSRTFATLMDKLSNTTDVDEFIAKLTELAKEDSRFVRLFVRLGGGKDWKIDFSQAKYKSANWRLFTQFYQTFTKQNPDAIAQYINDTQVYSGSAALTGAANMIKKEWVENIKALSKKSDSLITYESGSRTYKVKNISGIPIKELDDQIEFLKKMGVLFDKDAYLGLNTTDRNRFGRAVSNIHAFLQKANDIFSVTSKTLNIEGHLNTLSELYVKSTNPNQDTTHFNIDGNRTNSFAENNAPSVFENEFNESKTIQEFLKKRPEMNDVFSQHAILLQLGGPFWTKDGKRTARQLKIGYIGGTINVNKNKGVSTQRLNIGTRFTQEINQNLAGNYYILVPADSSTEWMMNLGNNISFVDIDSENGKSAWKKINSIFRGYLIDEVALALDYKNREKLRNISAKRVKQLRFFKEILSESLLTKIHNMILDKKSLKEITAEIDSNIGEVNASVKEFIERTTKETRGNLEKTGKIKVVDENNFSYAELDNDFTDDENVNINKFKMSDELVNNVLLFANANYIINNIELHKIIFGDPYQFEEKTKNGKTLLDETKRIKSFLSPRRTTFDHAAFRSFLNTEYNKTGLPEGTDRIQLKPSDPGYHTAKAYLRTITASDVNIIGRVLGKAKETDGMSWLTIDGYREIKQRNGQWSNDAETWYQWQMAYMRNRMAAKGDYKYDNPALEKHDSELIKKKEPVYKLDVLKPIVTGSKYNKKNIDLVLDKFSQMPMYYKAVENRTLEKLLVKMFNEKVDYIIVQSGRKVGAESLHDLYNPGGTFNQEVFTDPIDISWKTYGIQVENANEGSGGQQTMGSQVTKIVTMDLFENGEAVSKEGAVLYKKYNTILTNLFTNGYQRLLKDLGIEDLGFSFKLINNESIANTLRQEMLRRELPENAKDTLQLKDGEFPLPFEASSSYKQIKDILYSMVNKAIISPRMNGGGYVQVPVTMWENAKEGRRVGVKENGKSRIVTSEEFKNLSPEIQETAFFTDDTLSFYSKDKPYCEILLPHWFKDKFEGTQYDTDEKILKYLNDSEEGKEILKGIAFRIPTQLQSSIEAVVIKGFLPQSMGKTVVVPSEIVTKAGSDFDIDKLNMYLKSVYMDADGEIRLARFIQDEASTREFYGDVYDETIGKEIEKLEKYEGFREKIVSIFETIESLEVVDTDSIQNKLSEEDYKFYKLHNKLLSEIVNQAAEKDMNPSSFIREQIKALGEKKESLIAKQLNQTLKENYVEDMYRRALENEYYDTMYKIITLPENLERLLSPVDDDGLSDLADELDELRGYDESNIKNRILDRNYMTTLRHAFVSAKRWIGIAAVNITGHSLYQKTKVYIDPEMFENVNKADKKILGDGFIALDHNTVDINGNKYISLSGRKDSAGRFISNGLSGFATTFVDVAKDPYIMKIIKNEMVVGTFMFARRIGISREDIVMFMNQPIIDSYLTMLDNSGDKSLFKDANIIATRMQFPAGGEQGVIDVNNFRGAIKEYYQGKLSDKQNADQQEIFTQFLRLAKMADYSYRMSQAVNYDTTRFKSGDSLFQKQVRTQLAREANIINSVDNILNNSHIGHQELLLDYSMEALGEIMKLERDDFREITDELLRRHAENFYMSADDYEKIAIRIKASFLDYIIQTKSNIASNISRLLVEGGDVLVDRLAALKVKYPNLQILKDLVPATSIRVDGAKSIELKANLKDAYDENLYTGMLRELRDSGNLELNEFYHDLVTLSILQGTLQSPISIKNVIPIEDYSAQIKDIIAPLTVDEDVRNFNKGAFQRNNWKNDDVFEEYEPRFFQSEEPVDIDPYTMEDIYEYFSYSFQPNKKLNLGRNQRMLMFVSENSYASQSDYLKVRRTIQQKDKDGKPFQSWVDLRSGVNIFAADFVVRKKRGDLALQDYYGYERVTYEDGTPLTITNSKGYTSYVYKLINLLGDGMYASEYYLDRRPSAMNNGTVKVEKELTNGEIIQAFTERTDKANTDTSSPKSLANTIQPTETSEVKYSNLKLGDRIIVASKNDPNTIGTMTVSDIEKPDFIRFDLKFSDGTNESAIGYSEKEFNELFAISKPMQPAGINELQLRDGVTYLSADINGTMLENMGYSPLEIAEILKQIC
jgi:hypothetical protein